VSVDRTHIGYENKNLAIANGTGVSCAQYVEGSNSLTLKSRLDVTQGHRGRIGHFERLLTQSLPITFHELAKWLLPTRE